MTNDINLHVYPSFILNEGRIMRETASVAVSGMVDHVVICGIARRDLPRRQRVDEHRTIERVGAESSHWKRSAVGRILFTTIWSLAVLRRFVFRKLTVINAHSVAVLPVCFLLSRATGARLIYDTHELETETVAARGIQKRLFRMIEARLIRRCDAVFVVNESIAEWYRARYGGLQPLVVRNIPRIYGDQQPLVLRPHLGVPEPARLYVHAGNIGVGRNVEDILRAFASEEVNDHVVFLGDGPLAPFVDEEAALHQNIHRVPPVAPDEVVPTLSGCDVGLCLIESSCLSYELSLPNKALEYVAAQLPFFYTGLREVQRLLRPDNDLWLVSGRSDGLIAALTTLTDDEVAAARISLARIELPKWECEAESMLGVYGRLLENRRM
jgi:glycosyltransferase involved in cell wall biosynthesis